MVLGRGRIAGYEPYILSVFIRTYLVKQKCRARLPDTAEIGEHESIKLVVGQTSREAAAGC